jgi:hypothetical protein
MQILAFADYEQEVPKLQLILQGRKRYRFERRVQNLVGYKIVRKRRRSKLLRTKPRCTESPNRAPRTPLSHGALVR